MRGADALAFDRLRQEAEWVDQLPVEEDLIMEVRAGRTAGRADEANHVAASDRITGLHAEAAQVAVTRRQSELVLQHDEIAVFSRAFRRLDDAVGRRVDRLALLGRNVETLMETRLASKGIRAATEGSGQPPIRRPD